SLSSIKDGHYLAKRVVCDFVLPEKHVQGFVNFQKCRAQEWICAYHCYAMLLGVDLLQSGEISSCHRCLCLSLKNENGLLVVSGSGPAVTSNWAVCCTLNPPVLPPIPPEGVKVPGGTRT
ncbi:hypothetical protein Tco_0855111, partial [Tanacetum coccineum]